MPTTDPLVDAYIAQSGDFAKPILRKLRAMVHKACPDVIEKIKWGAPAFEHKGPLCGMMAFKKHCAFGFWKSKLLLRDKDSTFAKAGEKLSWGVKGRDPEAARISHISELPSDAVLLKIIKEAKRLNDEGVALPKHKAKPARLPADFGAALKKSKKSLANFESFSPSQKREYIDWITEAKREETRRVRIATAVEWISEGKIRNWKYQKR
ncbi:MAG: YdeI/OmpD-associated family protein [Phycisphaeraceae bacterium]|nr:YdeI/OmpD-associated family protein [Phycisphaeraceae bacterium]